MLLAKCITNWSMTVQHSDKNFANLLHENLECMRGRSIYDLTHPDDLKSNRQHLDDLRRYGRPFSIVKRYVRADGSTVWVKNYVSLIDISNAKSGISAEVQEISAPNGSPAGNTEKYFCFDNDSYNQASGINLKGIEKNGLALVAERILMTRMRRSDIFGDNIFGDPNYEIILHLFANEVRHRSVSISNACMASGVPMTTALRHIGDLVARGWVKRTEDRFDRRRSILRLSAECSVRVHNYLSECLKRENMDGNAIYI